MIRLLKQFFLFSTISSILYSFQPQTKAELQTAVDLWVSDEASAISTYGEINAWDVSFITDMSRLFVGKTTFNGDISNWNVSNVTNMNSMFQNTSSFNGDISNWDVSNVTNMFNMFVNAASFSSDLSTWDVSNVTNMQGLFACYGCNSTFNSDLSSWDVSNVENMRGMFSWISYNQDLSDWDVSSVRNMSEMFWGNNAFNQDLSQWDVSIVSTMSHMFQGSASFNQDISEWNVANVSNMKQMFQGSNTFNQDLSQWDVSNVRNMSNIFDGANSLTEENKCSIESTWSLNENWPYDWSEICTETVFQPQTKGELQSAVNLWVSDNSSALATYGEINTWDVSLMNDLSDLFHGKTSFNDDISNWDVSNVTTLRNIFRVASSFNQNLSTWDVSNVTSMHGSFMQASQFNGDISSWNLMSVNSLHGMFIQASSFDQNISDWDVSNVNDFGRLFENAASFNQDISSWDVSSGSYFSRMFLGTSALSDENKCAIHISFSSNEIWNSDWFILCAETVFQPQTKVELQTAVDLWVSDEASATSTYGEISTWDVSLITDMSSLFQNKSSFNNDIGNWDVSNVIDMQYMFKDAESFNHNLNNWDVSNVTNMAFMFAHQDAFNNGGNSLNWNTSNVTNMEWMFYASSFNQDISNWDVSNVTRMNQMFYGTTFNQDISSWDVSNVTTMHRMFIQNNTFNQDISSWDVSSVTNFSGMFAQNQIFNQDISTWDVSSATNMNDMFTVSGPLSEDNRCAIHTSFSVNNNWPYDWSSDCAYKVFVFNKTSIADIINTHENLNAVAGGSYNIEDYDVFFNIRSSNQNPEQMLEWIYNGGTWIGEWSSNDYPINNWNLIQGSVNGGTSGAQGTPIIHIPSHWLAQNVDWNSVPVGSEAVQFMRNITINDPDANVIVSLNHRSFGEVPLLVEKRYGDGTIILFNCDYQDDPASVSDLIQKVAHYAAEFVGDEADIDINTDPLITSVPSINALDGSLYEYSVYSSDADGDDIVVTATTKPDWLSVSNNNSNFLNFDGDYDYVELPELGDPVDAMTVQFWLKKSVNSDVAFIMGQTGWSDQYLHLDVTDDSDGQKINFSINNGGYSSSEDNVVVDDGWHNIAVTYENSTIKFYYDGNPWGEVQNNGSLININGFRLGNHFNDSRWLSGNLDNYAIWSIALSESEVQSNMNTALTGDEPGLIGYWNFDESEGTTLTDLSGNGNNGTIYGATWESSSTTVLSGTPSNSDGGLHEIVLTAEDGNGGIATQSYTLAVSLHSLEISGETSFRMFSSPVSGTIFGDLLDELWTQGAEGSDNPNSNPNIWTFENEWNSVTDFGADALAAGQGFLMYVYADTDFDGEDDLPVTISIDGEQHQSGVSVDSEPSAWNMMGNPYGLAVDISQMLTDNNSTFNSTVYALDLVNPGYKFHNGNIGNIDDGEIKPFEGFWIESNEDGNTFHFTEQSIKKGSLESPARTSRDGSNGHAVFTFSNGTYSTSTYLSFTPEGEINLDPADADRLIPMTLVEHLTSMIYESNKSLAINNLPSDLSVDLMMDMDVMMLAPNSNNGYTTQAEQIDFTWDITSLPEGITVGLIDNVTGQAINLAESTSTGISTIDKGSFETSGGFMGTYPAVGESQFTLTIYGITTASVEDEILPARVALNGAYPNPFNPSTIISFDLKETEMVSLEIFDIAGRQVATLVDKQMIPGKHQVSWNPVNLSSGLYLVNLVVGLETFNQKITYIK